MATAAGLLLLLLGVSQGLSAHCDARKDGAPCSGTLGETVFLRLIDNASGIRIDLRKENVLLLIWRKNVTDTSLLRCGLMFAAAVLICGGIGLFFKWKETKYKKIFITPQRNVNAEEFQVIEQRNLADI